jgi:hypothetical protein
VTPHGHTGGMEAGGHFHRSGLASAYNADPPTFRAFLETLRVEVTRLGRPAEDFPNALVTMWAWIDDHGRRPVDWT